MTARFEKESGLVTKIRELRGKIEETAEQANAAEALGVLRAELSTEV